MPMALISARAVRLRPAWSRAMRATAPNFRKAETLLTASILTAFERYNDAAECSGEPFCHKRHLISR